MLPTQVNASVTFRNVSTGASLLDNAFRHAHWSLLQASDASLKGPKLSSADASTTSLYYRLVLGSKQGDTAEKVARMVCRNLVKSESKPVHVN